MIDKNFIEFSKLMLILEESTGTTISKDRIKIYFELCKDLEIEQLKENVYKLLKERVYSNFPQVAEIRGVGSNTREDNALKAWPAFQKAVENYGYYDSVQFQDRVIHCVIENLGGWEKIANEMPGDFDELQWYEKEFEKIYEVCKKRKKFPLYIEGAFEKENGKEKEKIIAIDYEGKKKESLTLKELTMIERKEPLAIEEGECQNHDKKYIRK